MAKGRLFVISGPSGVGKGTLRKALFKSVQGLEYSRLLSTREPRNREIDGWTYQSSTSITSRIWSRGRFLSGPKYNGNFYGTLRKT